MSQDGRDLEREWMGELGLCFLCGVPIDGDEDEDGLCPECSMQIEKPETENRTMTAWMLNDLEAMVSSGCGNPECSDPHCGETFYLHSPCCNAAPYVSFTKGTDHLHVSCSQCEKSICAIAVAGGPIVSRN